MVTANDMVDAILHPTLQACDKSGISLSRLLKDLKKELSAKETKLIKVKKNPPADKVLDEISKSLGGQNAIVKSTRYRVIYETTEEILLAVDMVNWSTRQSARMDAHKLRGDYPAAPQKIEIEVKKPLVMISDANADSGSGGASKA